MTRRLYVPFFASLAACAQVFGIDPIDYGPDSTAADGSAPFVGDSSVRPTDSSSLEEDAAPVCMPFTPLDGGQCNKLTATGSYVQPTCGYGPAPKATGGTILDGHYVLTSEQIYGNGTCPNGDKEDLVICGSQWLIGSTGSGAAVNYTQNLTAAASSPNIILTETCDDLSKYRPPPSLSTYSATASTLTLFRDNTEAIFVTTYTHQ